MLVTASHMLPGTAPSEGHRAEMPRAQGGFHAYMRNDIAQSGQDLRKTHATLEEPSEAQNGAESADAEEQLGAATNASVASAHDAAGGMDLAAKPFENNGANEDHVAEDHQRLSIGPEVPASEPKSEARIDGQTASVPEPPRHETDKQWPGRAEHRAATGEQPVGPGEQEQLTGWPANIGAERDSQGPRLEDSVRIAEHTPDPADDAFVTFPPSGNSPEFGQKTGAALRVIQPLIRAPVLMAHRVHTSIPAAPPAESDGAEGPAGGDRATPGRARDLYLQSPLVHSILGSAGTGSALHSIMSAPVITLDISAAGISQVDGTTLSTGLHAGTAGWASGPGDMHPDQSLRPLTTAAQEKLAASVRVQLVADMRPGAPGVISLHLSPAELGAVQIRIMRSETGVQVLFQVERAETLDLMRRFSTELAQDLKDMGFSDAELSFSQGGAQEKPHQARARAAVGVTPAIGGAQGVTPMVMAVRHAGEMDLRI